MLNIIQDGGGYRLEMEETDKVLLHQADTQLLQVLFRELRPMAEPNEAGPIKLAYAEFIEARVGKLKGLSV